MANNGERLELGRDGGWLDAARAVPLLDVVAALDVRQHLSTAKELSFGPCPSCGARSRANRGKDPRGRCRVFPDGNGWRCESNGTEGCGAKGDGVALVAYALTGRAWARGDADTAVLLRAWYADRGWCDTEDNEQRRTTPARPRLALVRPAAGSVIRPPAVEIAALWGRCVPVTEDPEVSAWLTGRADGAIDPAVVAALDLARALPADLRDPPRWAWRDGGTWAARDYRLIVQAWEADPDTPGQLRVASLHARNVAGREPKAASPFGASFKGLVFATGPDPAAHGLHLVELAEGVPDFLRLAVEIAALPVGKRSAVLGVVNGSADSELAEVVPEGWKVLIRTHADKNGDKYAAKWAEVLAPRGCILRRQRKVNGGTASTLPSIVLSATPDPDPVPVSKEIGPEWTREALDALADAAGNGAALALVWWYCDDNCGGVERVPPLVAATHLRTVEGLGPVEAERYRAKLRELGGDDAGR